MSYSPLRVIGVPEAFNDPWTQADFSHLSSIPQFQPFPGGSGAMINALVSNQADIAFVLTDCLVAAIENQSPVRLISPLVTTPLVWAVAVSPISTITTINDLSNATWGVSRLGSGSHVMARTLAKEKKWPQPKFVVCGGFDGLRKGLDDKSIDVFLWERFTTRPFEREGVVRLVGEVPTPWGCFCVAVKKGCERLKEVYQVVDAFLKAGESFLHQESSVQGIVERYRMTEDDAKQWIQGVQYAKPGVREVDKQQLILTRDTLVDAGVIKEDGSWTEGMEGYYAQ